MLANITYQPDILRFSLLRFIALGTRRVFCCRPLFGDHKVTTYDLYVRRKTHVASSSYYYISLNARFLFGQKFYQTFLFEMLVELSCNRKVLVELPLQGQKLLKEALMVFYCPETFGGPIWRIANGEIASKDLLTGANECYAFKADCNL